LPFEEIIENIFSQRAKKISGHDPWRYGEELAKKTDEIEFDWLKNNLIINEETKMIDVGCGTGRHVIYMSTLTEIGSIIGCDFIEEYINFLNDNIKSLKIKNAKGVISKATDFVNKTGINKVDIVIAIGVIQYLTTKNELTKFVDNCSSVLNKNGTLILKHPLSVKNSYVLDYERKEMDTRYIAKYYNLTDIMAALFEKFELIKIERVFTEDNLGEDLNKIENEPLARQMWLHLLRK
jgi:cyclopropane fatty-acyl-phospholipid synthase-like methyltransferase